MQRRRVLASALALATGSFDTVAQVAKARLRIGWLTAQRAPSLAPYVAVFRTALAGLGYEEGRNLQIEFRYGDDVLERVPALFEELVALRVDLIVAQGAAVGAIYPMQPKVPVVFVFSGDPVAAGFAETLARPRNNMTGLTFMAVELNGKRLELLREFVPDLERVAILANPEHPGEERERGYTIEAARRLGLSVDYFATRSVPDIASAFSKMAPRPPQAISVFADGFAVQNRQAIVDGASRLRVPVISGWSVFADSGALCSYGPRLTDSYRRLASYVARLAQGTSPTDLPIEQPSTFEMVVNLRTANALSIRVPQSVLLRADRVIQAV